MPPLSPPPVLLISQITHSRYVPAPLGDPVMGESLPRQALLTCDLLAEGHVKEGLHHATEAQTPRRRAHNGGVGRHLDALQGPSGAEGAERDAAAISDCQEEPVATLLPGQRPLEAPGRGPQLNGAPLQ